MKDEIFHYTYRRGGNFTRIEPPFPPPANGSDCDAYLEGLGWNNWLRLPHNDDREFGDLEVYVWHFESESDADPAAGAFLIEVTMANHALLHVFCRDALDLVELLRDWLWPLVAQVNHDTAIQRLIEACDILLDRGTGLPAAQRHATAEWQRMQRRQKA